MSAQAPSSLSICLLGSTEVKRAGKVVVGLRQKSKWLLALLVLQRGKEIEYELLGRWLWPGTRDHKQIISSVRQCISNLNTLLGSDRFTKSSRSVIGIDLQQVSVDVFDFDAAASAIHDPALLRRAVDLYTGDILEDCTQDWIQSYREARRQAYQRAMEILIEQALASGDLVTAERYLRSAIAADRYKEANRCSLMRLLMRRGEYNAALDVYDQYRKLLEDPTRGAGPEMKRLWEAMKTRVAPEKNKIPHASKAAAAPVVDRLPRPDRALVGREEALREVAALFLFGRLVTLKGPPGIGKTHLALHVAAHLREDYPDGTAYLDLTEEKSPRDLWRAITTALQIPDQPRRNVEETVCDYLESRQMLLVLDNCDAVILSGGEVVREILQECPYVRILATSRTAWGAIPGARIYTVQPLSLPAPALLKRLPVDPLLEFNAFAGIRLFLERVSEIHSTFVLTSEGARAVAQICSFLDGVPFAILLAAGWIQTLTPEQIRDHLLKGPDLLRTPRQTAFGSQDRSMLTLETSYKVLPLSLQTLFRRLSVFHGGWTLQAAEDVCQTTHLPDGLRQLQECSLVAAEQGDGEMRFRLLGILRQFGERLLLQSAEANTLRHRYLDLFVRIAESATPELIGPRQESTLARLDRETENFTAALTWACESRETAKGLRLAGALWRFWHVRGRYQEGLFWLGRLLQQEPVETGPFRAKALNGAGNLAFQSQDYSQARAWFQERLEFEQAQGNPRPLAGALGSLANVTSELGDYALARSLFERSLAYFRELDDKHGIVMTQGNLAVVSCREGNLREACALHEECAAFFRSIGDKNHLAVALNNSADIRLSQQEFAEAAALLVESLGIGRNLESRHTLAYSLAFAFLLLAQRDTAEQAALLLGATDAFLERTQLPLPFSVQAEYRRHTEQLRATLDPETFQSVCARGGRMTLEETIKFAQVSLKPVRT